MRAPLHIVALVLFAVITCVSASAQAPQLNASQQTDPAITPNSAIGEVKAIDGAAKQLVLKTDAGSVVTVTLSDKTAFMRLAPGEKTLSNAVKIAFTEVSEGDRVWARGKVSEDRKTVPAAAVIVMTKADLAKQQEAERAEWRRRGILGVVAGVNPATKEVTISSRSMGGTQSVVIPVSDKVDIKRYAPDSIKFSDAKTGTFDEVKVGDQLRALGERSTDGTRFSPDKIVTGSFRTVAGAVTAVDPTTGEIKINDMQTKQPLTIIVKNDAVLRKFESGGMMFGRGPGAAPGGATAGQTPEPSQTQPGDRPQRAGGGGPRGPGGAGGGGMRGGGGGNIQEMLERLPTIALADVKVGDTIIVSSTRGADPARLTAITLVSGADALLNMMAARQQTQPGGQTAPNPSAGLGSGIQFGIGLP